jgi:HTH-like domain
MTAAADGDAAAETDRGREREATQAGGGFVAGPGDASGRHPPKTLRPARKRKPVDAVCGAWDVSIRRACRVLEVDTSTYHYKSRRHNQAGLEARIKDICATRVRYGYRRVHVVLRREGWSVNAKKVYRIYNELGLQLRNMKPKRWAKAHQRTEYAANEAALIRNTRPKPTLAIGMPAMAGPISRAAWNDVEFNTVAFEKSASTISSGTDVWGASASNAIRPIVLALDTDGVATALVDALPALTFAPTKQKPGHLLWSGFCMWLAYSFLVAGIGFEPMTFRL